MMAFPRIFVPSASRAIPPAGFADRRRISAISRSIATLSDGKSDMSVIDTRRQQIFPILVPAQIEMAKRFASGPPHDFAPGEIVYDIGERHAPTRSEEH